MSFWSVKTNLQRGRKLDPGSEERSSKNPNDPKFYDRLYQGRFEINNVSVEYQYEGPERKKWYEIVARLPFFGCPGRLLDVGCGTAGLLDALSRNPSVKLFGIDFSQVAVNIAKARVNGGFSVGDIHCLPYKPECFDRIVSTETFEHIDDPEIVLQEMYRVLRPGGGVMITVPETSLDLKPSEWPGGIDLHVNKFTAQSLCDLVARSGFVVEECDIVGRELWLLASKAGSVDKRFTK